MVLDNDEGNEGTVPVEIGSIRSKCVCVCVCVCVCGCITVNMSVLGCTLSRTHSTAYRRTIAIQEY